jgi:hypothetical protein
VCRTGYDHVLYMSISIYPSTYLPIYLSTYLSIYPYIHTPIYPYIHLSIHTYTYLSIHTPIYPYIHTLCVYIVCSSLPFSASAKWQLDSNPLSQDQQSSALPLCYEHWPRMLDFIKNIYYR